MKFWKSRQRPGKLWQEKPDGKIVEHIILCGLGRSSPNILPGNLKKFKEPKMFLDSQINQIVFIWVHKAP